MNPHPLLCVLALFLVTCSSEAGSGKVVVVPECSGTTDAAACASECVDEGLCTLGSPGAPGDTRTCKATNDCWCTAATGCKSDGWCHMDAARHDCAPTSDADCYQSDACHNSGKCKRGEDPTYHFPLCVKP